MVARSLFVDKRAATRLVSLEAIYGEKIDPNHVLGMVGSHFLNP
jgi:hypothetical protein